ncbi:riboflavin synthase [Blattabacterium cuenoti]|uniref:riboflavin synthase n=1 Tax=Blattabacterium cuenoti TaxID=1653831 RepID=UPI00163C901B|nr:riboflavin synthase [Blattabacterium cuenoti]
MFTGIIECTTKVCKLNHDKKNLFITFINPFLDEIKINQSICHNGICFTVININIYEKTYSVIASEETLFRTNLNFLKIKDEVNLERALMIFGRLNGHLVQGHVDTTAQIIKIENRNGSWLFYFKNRKKLDYTIIEKGSIAINGISLTIITHTKYIFSVSIIPYTYNKTNLHLLKVGDIVNVEFDIFGKYISKYLKYYDSFIKRTILK